MQKIGEVVCNDSEDHSAIVKFLFEIKENQLDNMTSDTEIGEDVKVNMWQPCEDWTLRQLAVYIGVRSK